MKRFADETSVDANRSRAEIDRLLEAWGATSIQWTTERASGRATLRFTWTWEGVGYRARMSLRMPTDKVLREIYARPHNVTAKQLDAAREQRWRSLHRLLLLTLKAQLNAVEAGLGTAVEVFLPYLEDRMDRTVAELLVPNLTRLNVAGSRLLIEGPTAADP